MKKAADWLGCVPYRGVQRGELLPAAQSGVIPVPVEASCLETQEHRGTMLVEVADVRARSQWSVGPMQAVHNPEMPVELADVVASQRFQARVRGESYSEYVLCTVAVVAVAPPTVSFSPTSPTL